MATNRMTKQSRENIEVADRAFIVPAAGGGFMVQLYAGDNAAIVNGSDGPVIYKDRVAAIRAIRRVSRAGRARLFVQDEVQS
jgi:hypothetical protein